jgi:hypothetical protein
MYGEIKMDNTFYFEKGRDRYGDLGLEWRILLKCIVEK